MTPTNIGKGWWPPEFGVYLSALSSLLRAGAHDLTAEEVASVIPPRGPSGCVANRVRGTATKVLNRAGFTFHGRRLL